MVMEESTTQSPENGGVLPARPDFGAFYRETHPRVARALALTLGDVALGEEAADEAMVRCNARWATVQGHDNALGWVYRSGLDWALSKRRRTLRAPRFRPSGPPVPPPATDPAIGESLAGLSVDLRTVIVCRYLFDWSVDQTADALRIRATVVEARTERALAQIQQKLDDLQLQERP
jgi:RNA polymerase sigma-70 factor (ECF subfamily)